MTEQLIILSSIESRLASALSSPHRFVSIFTTSLPILLQHCSTSHPHEQRARAAEILNRVVAWIISNPNLVHEVTMAMPWDEITPFVDPIHAPISFALIRLLFDKFMTMPPSPRLVAALPEFLSKSAPATTHPLPVKLTLLALHLHRQQQQQTMIIPPTMLKQIILDICFRAPHAINIVTENDLVDMVSYVQHHRWPLHSFLLFELAPWTSAVGKSKAENCIKTFSPQELVATLPETLEFAVTAAISPRSLDRLLSFAITRALTTPPAAPLPSLLLLKLLLITMFKSDTVLTTLEIARSCLRLKLFHSDAEELVLFAALKKAYTSPTLGKASIVETFGTWLSSRTRRRMLDPTLIGSLFSNLVDNTDDVLLRDASCATLAIQGTQLQQQPIHDHDVFPIVRMYFARYCHNHATTYATPVHRTMVLWAGRFANHVEAIKVLLVGAAATSTSSRSVAAMVHASLLQCAQDIHDWTTLWNDMLNDGDDMLTDTRRKTQVFTLFALAPKHALVQVPETLVNELTHGSLPEWPGSGGNGGDDDLTFAACTLLLCLGNVITVPHSWLVSQLLRYSEEPSRLSTTQAIEAIASLITLVDSPLEFWLAIQNNLTPGHFGQCLALRYYPATMAIPTTTSNALSHFVMTNTCSSSAVTKSIRKHLLHAHHLLQLLSSADKLHWLAYQREYFDHVDVLQAIAVLPQRPHEQQQPSYDANITEACFKLLLDMSTSAQQQSDIGQAIATLGMVSNEWNIRVIEYACSTILSESFSKRELVLASHILHAVCNNDVTIPKTTLVPRVCVALIDLLSDTDLYCDAAISLFRLSRASYPIPEKLTNDVMRNILVDTVELGGAASSMAKRRRTSKHFTAFRELATLAGSVQKNSLVWILLGVAAQNPLTNEVRKVLDETFHTTSTNEMQKILCKTYRMQCQRDELVSWVCHVVHESSCRALGVKRPRLPHVLPAILEAIRTTPSHLHFERLLAEVVCLGRALQVGDDDDDDPSPFLEQCWLETFRVLDDMDVDMRKAGEHLAKTLTKATLSRTVKIDVLGRVLHLVLDKGLTSSVVEVRAVSRAFVVEWVTSATTPENESTTTVINLLQSVIVGLCQSVTESVLLSYAQFHARGGNGTGELAVDAAHVEAMRATLAVTCPEHIAAIACVNRLKVIWTGSEQIITLVQTITRLLRNAGFASFLSGLACLDCILEDESRVTAALSQGDGVLTCNALMKVLTHRVVATGNEAVGMEIKRRCGASLARVARFADKTDVVQVCNLCANMYFTDGEDVKVRQSAAEAAYQLARHASSDAMDVLHALKRFSMLARFDSDAQVAELFSRVFDIAFDHVYGAQDIQACVDALSSGWYRVKVLAAKAMCEIPNVAHDAIGSAALVATVLHSSVSHNYHGKEVVMECVCKVFRKNPSPELIHGLLDFGEARNEADKWVREAAYVGIAHMDLTAEVSRHHVIHRVSKSLMEVVDDEPVVLAAALTVLGKCLAVGVGNNDEQIWETCHTVACKFLVASWSWNIRLACLGVVEQLVLVHPVHTELIHSTLREACEGKKPMLMKAAFKLLNELHPMTIITGIMDTDPEWEKQVRFISISNADEGVRSGAALLLSKIVTRV